METAPKLSTPEEELAYLRAQVAQKEIELEARGNPERERIIEDTIEAHTQSNDSNLAPEYRLSAETQQTEADALRIELELGGSDHAIQGLQNTLEKKGIKNALSVLEKMDDPHLTDDFHRYLLRYISAGLPALDVNEKAPKFKALKMTLYEITLPGPDDENKERRSKSLKEQISGMEQLYAGLLSIGSASVGEPEYYALELAIPAKAEELQFYASIPNSKCDLFEKQLLAIFPDAHIELQSRDYNIFAEKGFSMISTARLSANPALPIKEYPDFDYDPLNAVLNAFSKMSATDEGAAFQLIIEPRGDRHVKHFRKILQALRKGEKHSDAFSTPETVLGELAHEIGKTLFSSKPKDEQKAKEAETRQVEENKSHVEQVEKKIASPIAGVTLRIAVSGKDEATGERVIGDIESAFHQFGNTQGNQFKFSRLSGRKALKALEAFSFRIPNADAMPLSLREITTIFHFPPSGIESSPHLKQSRFATASAPIELPREGILLGHNTNRGTKTDIFMTPEDRLRHLYVIGQTGTGKSGLLTGMIMQDIKNGEGCCFIDPHGNDILNILASVPPERYNDVIYFDPADIRRPFALNFLEYDQSRPEQKTFIVNELLMIFRRLYGDVPESMGPAFEQYFRNATQLVMEDPESGSTILDIARVLSNKTFRDMKVSRCMNPVVNQFWTEIATKAEGDASLANIVPYITNKFDDFTANDFVRPIVGQQKSSFNFRDIMDNKKILLVNLSKGRLGERNANLLGLVIVGKLFMSALSRADNPRTEYAPFYLYIDEFQNVTTDSIPGILSEARKYKLGLSMAHQFLKQIDEKISNAVFGNVGSMAVFRVGEDDAEFFEKQFTPAFTAIDFVNLKNREAYVKLLANGMPQRPFNIRSAEMPAINLDQVDDLIELSALTYGRDRATVENMIRERYLS